MGGAINSRVAVVTGGGSGIGAAIAQQLAAQGALVIVSDLERSDGARVAEQIGGLFLAADLGSQNACKTLIEQVGLRFGRLDILVNNAGFQHLSPIDSFPLEAWDALMAVMLTAPFLLTKYGWPLMRDRGWGRIVNVSSIHGVVASPNKAGYISAKHGLIGLTRATAIEGGQFGITANAVCPGWTRTPLVENQLALFAQAQGVSVDEILTRIGPAESAIKRLIEPEEIAATVSFLASDAAAAITGSVQLIDGGFTTH